MNFREKLVFFHQVASDTRNVGAIFTTGATACRALCAEIRRRPGPLRILEVGCGTGPVTSEIVVSMSDQDRLTVCDINDSFVDFVKKRFEKEPKFQHRAHQVEFYAGDITEYEGENEFDLIVSSIPLTTLSPELLRKVLDHFRYMLKPGGTVTYIEYAYLRDLRDALQPWLKNARFEQVNAIIKETLDSYEYRTEVIRWNFLPGVVRSLRFDAAPDPGLANLMRPDPEQRRVKAGPFYFASDGIPTVTALLCSAALWKRTGKRGWTLPLAAAAFTAWAHRDPKRLVLGERNFCLAAADGRVTRIQEVRHPRLGDETWTRIEIAVGPGDVHVNRSPVAGRVVDRWDEPAGESPGSIDTDNGSSVYLVLETERGRCAVAQRNLTTLGKTFTWCRQGELLTQGERFGLAPLAARLDIYLPRDGTRVLVEAGDKLIAGRTPVAKFQAPEDGGKAKAP